MKNDSFFKTTLYKILRFLPDKAYLSLKFYKNFKRLPNWKDPKTFNEKLQWLKLYNRKPEYTIMVDKYEAKKYVADIIGEEYIIPTLGLWDKAEDIDFEGLPDKFVLKTTHDSGSVIICKDKSKLDRIAMIDELNKSLKRDFYAITREWPYKNVKPRIIAEKLLETMHSDLCDYKIFCFNGKARFFKIDFNRYTNHQANYFDIDGNAMLWGEVVCPPDLSKKLELPKSLNQIIHISNSLSKDIPFVRIDFYDVEGHPYFGEITFFPNSGMGAFTDPEVDYKLGNLIVLPK